MNPNTCIEFTLAPLSPAWLPVLTTAGGDVPNYLARVVAAGERAYAFVISTDNERTVVVVPETKRTLTLPTNAFLDVVTLAMESSPDGERRVARPMAAPERRLEVTNAWGDMLDARVALVDAATVVALAKGFGP